MMFKSVFSNGMFDHVKINQNLTYGMSPNQMSSYYPSAPMPIDQMDQEEGNLVRPQQQMSHVMFS